MESILSQEFSPEQFEIVVVNDGSEDGTSEYLRSMSGEPRVRWFSQLHSGAARARNTGIEHARGLIIAMTDDDCTVPGNWLSQLQEIFRDDNLSAVGGGSRNLLPDNPYSMLHHEIWEFCFEHLNKDPDEPAFLTTNNFACRKSALLQVGGFDTAFRVGGEDRDLCLRLQHQGRKVRYVKSLTVGHEHSFTFASFFRHHIRMGEGARLLHRRRAERAITRRSGLTMAEYAGLFVHIARKRHATLGLQSLILLVVSQLAVLLGYGIAILKPFSPVPTSLDEG